MRRRSDQARLGLVSAAAAIFLAPFIALIYRAEAGLIVMAVALGAVSLLLHGAKKAAPAGAQARLGLVLGFNLWLIVACVALAAWMAARP